jgi:ABC-2 type transport system ATP-binding protein
MIEIIKLSKSFGPTEVLADINLELKKAKIYGVVGENGSGKTTLFKCIAGLEDYDGNIKSEFKPLKNHLGLLLTEPYFLSKITAREYVIMMCNARNKSYDQLDKKNIFDLPLDKYAKQYSTGMKKKLAILAVLMQGNDVFILDEPFNGVDVQSNILISEILMELKKLEKTVLISSHIFSSLTDICDEIFLLKNGEINGVYAKGDFNLLRREMNEKAIGDRIKDLEL